MLLDHADFALQEQAEDNLMVAFSWAWYNGSYYINTNEIPGELSRENMISSHVK